MSKLPEKLSVPKRELTALKKLSLLNFSMFQGYVCPPGSRSVYGSRDPSESGSYRPDSITQGVKNSLLQEANPPPTCPRNGCLLHQNHYSCGPINHWCIKCSFLVLTTNFIIKVYAYQDTCD
jgi:hypothetical protein